MVFRVFWSKILLTDPYQHNSEFHAETCQNFANDKRKCCHLISDEFQTVAIIKRHLVILQCTSGVQKASDQIRLATSFPMPPFKAIGEWGVQNNEVPKVVDTRSVRLSSVVKVSSNAIACTVF
jgi:hypothetical protein